MERITARKELILVSKSELTQMKNEQIHTISKYNVENLMTCLALAEHRLYGFGHERILRTLHYIDSLMGEIDVGDKKISDYKKELSEETGVRIEG